MVLALVGDSTMTRLPLRRTVLLFFDRFFEVRLPLFVLAGLLLTGGLGSVSWAVVCPLRYILVPHTGHFPLVAGVPLAAHSACGFSSSLFSLHLTQYASNLSSSVIALF